MQTKIMLISNLPDTVNAWGFGGGIHRKSYTFEDETFDNETCWVSGIACYRHTGSHPYFRNFSLGIDRVAGESSCKKFITKYYAERGIKIEFKEV